MSNTSVLRTDILPDALIESPERVRIVAGTLFNRVVDSTTKFDKTTTIFPSKNIIETMELIQQAIERQESVERRTEDAKALITYEEPDIAADVETISITLATRQPGKYDQGSPMEGRVSQLRPLLREIKEDPEHPGYKIAIIGYWYDNILQITPWARTNKTANQRALWLEGVLEDYTWWFAYSGVNRFVYQGRGKERTLNVQGNKLYGRPINYFVRTERITTKREKELEEILINLQVVIE